MIVSFPPPGTSTTVNQRWPSATIADHSPEFARHYRLDGDDALWGELKITGLDDDHVAVAGHVGFAPTLACGRCLKEGPLPVTTKVNVSVRLGGTATGPDGAVACSADLLPRPTGAERDADSSADADGSDRELDPRYLDIYAVEQREFDLLRIALDAVDLAIPEPVSFRDDSGHCGLCQQTIVDTLVATGGNPDATNPFAALKALKGKLKN